MTISDLPLKKNPNREFREKVVVIFQVLILAGAFFTLFYHTIIKLIHDWATDDNFSHGFLVPFIAMFMAYMSKDKIVPEKIRPSNYGLVFLLLGMALHVVGNLGAELFTMRFAIVVTIFGLVLYFYGWKITLQVLIPILYLLFMIPIPAIIWNKFAFPLKLFSARLTADVVQAIGIPILREGNILHVAGTTLEVADACSGIRSLMSLMALSAAFAYIVSLKPWKKWLLFASAVPVAVIVNIFRLTMTSILAQYYGTSVAQGFLHEISGIFVFLLALLLLYCVFYLLKTKVRSI